MGDMRALGADIKWQTDRIARGIIVLGGRYVANQINSKQLLQGMRNMTARVASQVDRLDVTVLQGQVEDMSKYHQDGDLKLGGNTEDMRNYRANDPDDTDADIDF